MGLGKVGPAVTPEPWAEGQPCVLLSRCPSVQACGSAVPTAQITPQLVLPTSGPAGLPRCHFLYVNSELSLVTVPL